MQTLHTPFRGRDTIGLSRASYTCAHQRRLFFAHCLQDAIGPPAQAFVRTVCAVLALDSAVADEVAVLRRNLLKLVHVREFAPSAQFQVSIALNNAVPCHTLHTVQCNSGCYVMFSAGCCML